MKKITFIIAILALVVLAGCGNKQNETSNDVKDPQTSVTVTDDAEENVSSENKEDKKEDNKKQEEEKKEETTKEEEKKPEELPASKPQADTRPLTEIMASLTNGIEDLPACMEAPLDEENFTFLSFGDYIEGAEGLASEAMINAVAHSVVLVRLPEGSDVAAFAAQVKANANPRKWVCVEAEKVSVVTKGNLVLLAMSREATVDAIVANFNK